MWCVCEAVSNARRDLAQLSSRLEDSGQSIQRLSEQLRRDREPREAPSLEAQDARHSCLTKKMHEEGVVLLHVCASANNAGRRDLEVAQRVAGQASHASPLRVPCSQELVVHESEHRAVGAPANWQTAGKPLELLESSKFIQWN